MKNNLIAITAGLLFSTAIVPVSFAGTYGPTAAHETLWSIASRLRPTDAVNTQQVMLAIRAKNPQAFTTTNINALKQGSVLELPTLAEIQQLDRTQALHTANNQNQHWQSSPPVGKRNASLTTARKTQARVTQEINNLRLQLKKEQQRSAKLQARIQTLQAAPNAAQAPNELTQLHAEITALKTELTEKNNHIQNLETSLREASDAIKRQYAENQALYDQLKATNPTTTQATTPPSSKPQLTLSGVGDPLTPNAANPAPSKPPVFTDQVQPTPPTTDANDPNNRIGTPLKSLLAQQNAAAAPDTSAAETNPSKTANTGMPAFGNGNSPSRVSFIIALISLLFITALLWRTFIQQRAVRRETAAMAKNTPAVTPQLAANDPVLPPKSDSKQESDLLL